MAEVSTMFDGDRTRFEGGYPTEETTRRAYEDADLVRAIQCYRFFYPTVSLEATWRGNLSGGVVPNKVFALLEGTPQQFVFTPNSDTPYTGLALDLSGGPMVLELPPGPLMGAVNDLNQLWVMDIGLAGPAKAAGGKHLVIPPGYDGVIPDDVYSGRSTTNRVLVLVRALPQGKDVAGAITLMKSVTVYPHEPVAEWTEPTWIDLSRQADLDFTPVQWEDNLQYWQVLHDIIDAEPAYEGYRSQYGELAALGIAKGAPFEPDERMSIILTRAAELGHAQLCVQSFADRRPERTVWEGRHWEWAVLRPENGTFETANYVDLYAREKWFYQAQIESPAMFARSPGAGSLYWLGLRDANGTYLNGSNTYTLTVPQPVPATLFWSITVYDAETRSEIRTEQNRAALRSLFELSDLDPQAPIVLHFGPDSPASEEAGRWIQTLPGQGWFVYFRIYGPDAPAFDGSWQLPDFDKTSQ
ncbi:hypothetical protein RW1_046_00450 [Rhodococcus wratislaviensis NBRC 100605]|uniref:DUF1254 domain-containing protein n=2 Tax=Rhodococcus wratislaviensis TaxID=44752 RepID=X0RA49_RHOWR|nr:hypothetical protein RW1_046_00450 [Rhodococcus wratislaviensis NBRC 100605]